MEVEKVKENVNLEINESGTNESAKKELKKKMSGFRSGGNLALGFLKKNVDKTGSDGTMSSSSCEDSNEGTPRSTPEKPSFELTKSQENIEKTSNAIIGFLVISRILNQDKITADIQAVASRLLDKFERCKAAGLNLDTMAKFDSSARKPMAQALLTIKDERDFRDNGLDGLIKTCKVWISKRTTEPDLPNSINKPNKLPYAPASIQPRTFAKPTSVIKLPQTMKTEKPNSTSNINSTATTSAKRIDLPNPPEFVMLDTSILLNSLNFIRDQLIRSTKLQGRPVIIPSLTIDGLDVVKSVEQDSRKATNWLLTVKKESFLKMVPCEGEYLKYNARSSHDQIARDKSRIKQLSKFARVYFKSNTTSGRVAAAVKNTKASKNKNSNNNSGLKNDGKNDGKADKIDELFDESKQSIILVSDRVAESAYTGIDNVYSLKQFKESFALT